MTRKNASQSAGNKILLSGVLIGIGTMALIDEIIFHQLLQWHHFFDFNTMQFGIFSDGLLNAFALFSIVAGIFLFAHVTKIYTYSILRWWSGIFIGLGAFQLIDATINHKLFGIHQIRYGVDILPYYIAWNTSAVLLPLIGLILWFNTRNNDASRTGSLMLQHHTVHTVFPLLQPAVVVFAGLLTAGYIGAMVVSNRKFNS